MPLIVPNQSQFPIYNHLKKEQVFIIDKSRAEHQDIRPLRIGLLNLMPATVREKTEIQFFRLLGNTPLQIEPVLFSFDEYLPNTGRERFEAFYEKFSEIKEKGLDGLIVTGANLETNPQNTDLLDFKNIHYVDEWRLVLDWAKKYVTSTIYSCLASHFALHHFYGLERDFSGKKIFGVFSHKFKTEKTEFTRGMNDIVYVPYSRWGNISVAKLKKKKDLEIVLENEEYGYWHLAIGRNGREIYLQGHPEYDREDLVGEYLRDKDNGQELPINYFPKGDYTKKPICNWKADASVFYRNWVNHVYQTTNYDLTKPFMKEG